MTTPAIDIHQITKQYDKLFALREVSFSIAQGSFFGLLGPNGAGKSTLINLMAGLTLASSGTIRVLGHDVRAQWRQARQALGVVPQELVFDPFFSVREMLRLQSGYFGLGRENWPWIDELLEILNLTDKTNTNLQKLSGGMKRRALIAQALVHKPQVVVLDEPTAGVDVELRQVLWEFTRRLHQQGHTILLTTHYLEEAEKLCQRIAILHHGQLIALDDKTALVNRYPYRRLRLEICEAPEQVAAKLSAILHDKVEQLRPGCLVLKLHRTADRIGPILDALTNAKIAFTDLHTSDPGLEDVFMSLTTEQH